MANRAEGIAEIIINDQQAQNALKELADKAAKLNDRLHEMRKANDKLGYDKTKKELDALNKEMKSYHKANLDVQRVLNNLSGSSYNELLKVQRQLRTEMRGMKRDTDAQKKAFLEKRDAVEKVDSELSKLQKNMKTTSTESNSLKTNFTNITGTVGKLLPMLGITGGLAGAFQFLRGIISATNAAGDKVAIVMGGINTGVQAFFKTLATGDFSNFLSNLNNAVIAGRDYIKVMDDVADRQLALSIAESKSRIEVLESMKVLRDVTATNDERIAAADRILEIEKKNAQTRVDIAKQAFDAELEKNAVLAKADKEKLLSMIEEYDRYKDLIAAADEYMQKKEKASKTPTKAGGGMVSQYDLQQQAKLKEEIKKTSQEVLDFVATYEGYLTLTDEQREAIGKAAKDFYDAQASFDQKTMETETQRASLLKQTANEIVTTTNNTQQALNSQIENFSVYWGNLLDEVNTEIDDIQSILVPEEQEIIEPEIEYLTNLWRESYDGRLEMLRAFHQSGLISTKEFNDKVKALQEEQTKWEAAKWSEKLQAASNAMGALSGLLGQASTAGKALAVGEALINTFLGATMALRDNSLPTFVRIATVVAVIATGLRQVAAIKAVQFADGKYDVIGANDRKKYRAGYVKQAATGIYPEPTLIGGLGLVGERAPELVVDGATLRNIQMNAPGIIEAINSMRRMPQYAPGNYSTPPPPQTQPVIYGTNIDPAIITELKEHGLLLQSINGKLDNPTRAMITYQDIKDADNEINDIKNSVSK